MIPQYIQNNCLWCVWKKEWRGDQPTKIPYNPRTDTRADSSDPSTFAPFERAYETFQTQGEYDGMGILVRDGIAAVDIDHCVEDGALSDLAREIIDRVNSYTEYSPSKTGLRIFFHTEATYDKQKYYIKNPQNGVELYVSGMTNRFVTITGNTLVNAPVRELSEDELLSFVKAYMKKGKTVSARLTDEQIIEKASASDKFSALFSGDMTAYNNDHSSADLALCNILAFWTGKDAAQMDSLFRKSGLYRADKWERKDYRDATISKAIADTHDTYDPAAARAIWDRLDVTPMNTGAYVVDATGVYTYIPNKKTGEADQVYVTPTPIAIAAFLENDVHRVELHYLYDNAQKTIVVDREIIANKNKVITLANYGIAVTSESALQLVKFFAELERLNPMNIARLRSCSHLGWLGKNFVPYDDSIRFDGEQENKTLFQAITTAGEYSVWREHLAELRKNIFVRLMVDASLASVLVEKINALPYVFHLWGSTSFGKTVTLMVAMSVWGDPAAGRLVRTMNMTDASMMSTAAFLYSIPFAGDELQTIKEQGQTYDKLIMRITEGIERGRMYYSKNLPTRSWHNAFLFTGEDPCTSTRSGGGVLNRVFEIGINEKIIPNGNATVKVVTANYGHAGKIFINHIRDLDVNPDYESIYAELIKHTHATDKQAATAALILLADKLAGECIFKGEIPLTPDDIAEYLKSAEAVSVAERAKDYITEWVSSHSAQFGASYFGETYGRIELDNVFVIKSVLERELEAAGFNFDAVKMGWRDMGFLIPDTDGRFAKRKAMGGAYPRCVELKLEREEEEPDGEYY